MYPSNITEVPIYSDDEELFRKCREIWNKINELVGINDPIDFVETTLDDDADKFIMLEVQKHTSAVRDNIEMIVYLFYILFLMIFLNYH